MKKLYFFFFLTIGFLGNAQIVNIPDENFKARLINNGIDINSDGNIQVSEAAIPTILYIDNSNIQDITGIQAFVNLEYFVAHDNSILNANFSGMNKLIMIKLDFNFYLNSINLTGCNALEELFLFECNLTQLSLSNLNSLHTVSCGENNLSNLNISNCPNIKNLYCGANNLTSLDLNEFVNLESLNARINNIVNIDLSNSPNLKFLDCSMNQLTNLNISNCTQLEHLECFSNNLTVLNVQNLSLLTDLLCGSNNLTTLDLSGCKSLINLFCSDNNLISIFMKNGADEGIPLLTNYYLDFVNNPNLEFICCDSFQEYFIQLKLDGYGYTNCHVNSYCSFTPGGTFYDISGTTKFDLNNNGCDISDTNFSNLNFSITDGNSTGSLIANESGNYYIPVSAGSHTITPNLENPSYFNISPASFTVDFSTQSSPFTQDFCVTANGIHHDVEIVLISTTPARPGFDAHYKLVFRNKGNQVENGSVVFAIYDQDVVDFVSSLPNFDSQTTTSIVEKFSWNYSNLQPFETREIDIVLNLNSPMETPALNAGELLSFDGQILIANTDEYIIDNFFGIRQEVVNSLDPNDKTCLQGETILPSEAGKYVHYMIRFENTGTFAAENIVVKDMIDLEKFDIATLVPLSSSHDFYTKINGDKVEFIFENINLDFNDATNDGYVMFKIKTKPTLLLGDSFSNSANIYFDYNFPITTNTYTTTFEALGTRDFDFATYFTLYPNPAKNILNIQTRQGLAIHSLEIYNQLGQVVMAVANAGSAVDVSHLSAQTYFIKINTEKGSSTAKFVKE